MQTDMTVQGAAMHTESKPNLRLLDSMSEFASLALTPEQTAALEQLLTALDRVNVPARLGFFSHKPADRSTLLELIVRPAAARKMRTPEHRKVMGLRLNASSVPDGMQPWHHLVMNMLELLTESAMPTERGTLNELRNELNRLIRLHRRDSASSTQPAVAFARRFQAVLPKLVVNTVLLANSVLLIVLDRLDEASPSDVAEWLEAAQFFCAAQGCVVLAAADETALIDKLNHSAQGVDGQAIMNAWLTRRVGFTAPKVPKQAASPAPEPPVSAARREVTPRELAQKSAAPRDGSIPMLRPSDVPMACARIINAGLQPDRHAVESAMAQWRLAMQAIVRRAEEGLGGTILAAMVAKLVVLRTLAPELHDAARYDAQMLAALERSARGETVDVMYEDWAKRIAAHPELTDLFTGEPAFSSADLRDLAAALRLTNTGEEPVAAADASRPGRLTQVAFESAGAAAQTLAARARAAEGRLVISTALMNTAFSCAAVFLFDRVVKLFVQSAAGPESVLLGGFLQAEFLPANAVAGSLWGGGVAVGAELFGLALAILIAVFWGGARRRASHSVGLGCIVGALASNLFDRLVYGGVFNYIHLANLPVFNLSHVALLIGALLLGYSLLRGPQPALDSSADHSRAGAN